MVDFPLVSSFGSQRRLVVSLLARLRILSHAAFVFFSPETMHIPSGPLVHGQDYSGTMEIREFVKCKKETELSLVPGGGGVRVYGFEALHWFGRVESRGERIRLFLTAASARFPFPMLVGYCPIWASGWRSNDRHHVRS